jgi:hypothetical protein
MADTGWRCADCGTDNPSRSFTCSQCGRQRILKMNASIEKFVQESVSLDRVATILKLIATKPGSHNQPQAGDPRGDTTFWFEGGRCKVETGVNRYTFNDGAKADEEFGARLRVTIHFPNGQMVTVQQSKA